MNVTAEDIQKAEQGALQQMSEDGLTPRPIPPKAPEPPAATPSLSVEALQQRIALQKRMRDAALAAFTATETYQAYLREDGKLAALQELLALLTATE